MTNTYDKLSHAATMEDFDESFGCEVLLVSLSKVTRIEMSTVFKLVRKGPYLINHTRDMLSALELLSHGSRVRGGAVLSSHVVTLQVVGLQPGQESVLKHLIVCLLADFLSSF
uniref:Uncharacterized protein n=1 Tax=Lepeophtheirus salmonis TaxID=72036 RepID=A0A0K2UF78_LEPSM